MGYLNGSRARQLNPTARLLPLLILSLPVLLALSGCTAHADPAAEAPPPANIVPGADPGLFTVDHPEQFPLTAATERAATSELVVTGAVTPDVTRNVPVVPLASGRVVGIHAKLGDTVQKGQLLLTIRSDDVMGGFDAYRKAIADELLARKQLNRAVDLYAHGAIAQQDLEVAQDAEDDAKVTLETATEHLRLLGNDPNKPMGMVDVLAPVSGVITDQEVTNASTVQAFNTPSPFTISDLSSMSGSSATCMRTTWPMCAWGTRRRSYWNAYPGRVFKGTISNIGAILDPSIRTAKVRIEVPNPGIMRLGMFVKATFLGQGTEMHTVVPASAVLHMHDRDFVFIPAPGKKFRRLEVVGGDLLPDNTNLQEIKSGLKPGQQVVTNALVLDHVLAQ